MEQYEIVAEPRTEVGKGAMRRLRRAGRVPAILYGAGEAPRPLHLDANELGKQLANEAFFSHILTVRCGSESAQAVLKDLQRDPASARVIHVDLMRVSSRQEITMNVPLHLVNEEVCPGRRHGGVVNQVLVDVEIACLPRDLPEYIDVDLSGLDLGDSVHLSELVLPEGVRLTTDVTDGDYDQIVVSINRPMDLTAEPVEEGVEAEEEIGEGEVPTVGETEEGAGEE